MGPARMTPTINNNQLPLSATPAETTPQVNAHIGGNHVTGLRSSRTVEKLGTLGDPTAAFAPALSAIVQWLMR